MRPCAILLALLGSGAAAAAERPLYTAVTGARVIDSGVFVVADGRGARQEVFEYVRRPDGGHTLVNSITAADGSYRVGGRFDYDSSWNVTEAHGAGLEDGVPVAIALVRQGKRVDIEVTGRGEPYRAVANCDPPCLIDLAPSITPMFAIVRHYDLARGGEQPFMWAGHALTRRQSLSDDRVQLAYLGESTIARDRGAPVTLRHFAFDETIPNASGPPRLMVMEIWADPEHRPYAFRVRPRGAAVIGTVGVRQGYEDLPAKILGN